MPLKGCRQGHGWTVFTCLRMVEANRHAGTSPPPTLPKVQENIHTRNIKLSNTLPPTTQRNAEVRCNTRRDCGITIFAGTTTPKYLHLQEAPPPLRHAIQTGRMGQQWAPFEWMPNEGDAWTKPDVNRLGHSSLGFGLPRDWNGMRPISVMHRCCSFVQPWYRQPLCPPRAGCNLQPTLPYPCPHCSTQVGLLQQFGNPLCTHILNASSTIFCREVHCAALL